MRDQRTNPWTERAHEPWTRGGESGRTPGPWRVRAHRPLAFVIAAVAVVATLAVPGPAIAAGPGGGIGDTTPPTVSIAAPRTGAEVSGMTTVTVTATDNRAVAWVQFKIDGLTVATDIAAPYAHVWNTLSALDGVHTLTAVAGDTSGNTATSAPVTVTVDNQPTGPPGQFTSSAYTVTVGQVVTFTDAHTGLHRRTIHFGDGTTKSARSPIFTKSYTAPGTYVVTLDTKDVVTQADISLSLTITVT